MLVIFNAWTVADIPNLNGLAHTTGILISISNPTGLVTSNMVAREAPKYMTALIDNASFSGSALGFIISYSV